MIRASQSPRPTRATAAANRPAQPQASGQLPSPPHQSSRNIVALDVGANLQNAARYSWQSSLWGTVYSARPNKLVRVVRDKRRYLSIKVATPTSPSGTLANPHDYLVCKQFAQKLDYVLSYA